jgi:branched-chain amino acid transport system ATP-binding protein
MMLKVENVTVRYGPILALDGVSLDVSEGEIVAILGANGAGKSTLLRAVSGLVPVASGRILFRDLEIKGIPPERLARIGLAHVPEGRRIFPGLTVKENLLVASTARSDRQGIQDDIERVEDLFPVLGERRYQLAWSLSGGEQQMLAIARALMARPELLMLDEPSLGLAPRLVRHVLQRIRSIREEGTTVLLVEQDAKAALRISDRAYILKTGTVALTGRAEELREAEDMTRAYLGT